MGMRKPHARVGGTMSKKTFLMILGYVIGGSVFLLLIPRGLFLVSRSFDHHIGIQLIPIPVVRIAVAAVLVPLGLMFGFWSSIVQNSKGEGGPLEGAHIRVSPKTKYLVVAGPYRYTRNPMLFGTCVFYYGIAAYLNSPIALVLVALFMAFMLIFVKKTEERRLLEDFGSDHQEYRRRVSMFVPWRQKRSEPSTN